MLNSSVFLTSVFSKYQIKDKKIRTEIMDAYLPLVDSIFEHIPSALHVLVFKELIPSIHSTIVYLQTLRAAKADIPPEFSKMAADFVQFSRYLIKNPPVKNSGAFDHIMKQVNLEEIGCDIGACTLLLKTAELSQEDRDDTIAQLIVLLADYNAVTGSNLTIEGILNGETTSEL